MFCCTLLYVHSSIVIILMRKRELVALLNLSSWCLVMVERLFLAVPWSCLRFVIVVFPDHTHLLFLCVRTAKALSRLCYAQACLSLHCKLMRKIPNYCVPVQYSDGQPRLNCSIFIYIEEHLLFFFFFAEISFIFANVLCSINANCLLPLR